VESLHSAKDEEATKNISLTLFHDFIEQLSPKMINLERRFVRILFVASLASDRIHVSQ